MIWLDACGTASFSHAALLLYMSFLKSFWSNCWWLTAGGLARKKASGL